MRTAPEARPASRFVFALLGAAVVSLATVAGCAATSDATHNGYGERSAATPGSAHSRANHAQRAAFDDPTIDALDRLDDESLAFQMHVTTLSNPFFEGRVAGTAGKEFAASYIEFYLSRLGLLPAFDTETETPGGEVVADRNSAFRQEFTVRGETLVHRAELAWSAGGSSRTLTAGEDFNPMGSSGTGAFDALPLAFAGYAIERGQEGYTSFPEGTDLTGKAVVLLRFEPMNEDGRSLWSERGWSNAAGLAPKINAAIERGASAVILVNPPGAADPRADRLLTTAGSRFGGERDIPMFAMTTEQADALVRAADSDGRSLMDLRALADSGQIGVLDLPRATLRGAAELEQTQLPTHNVGAVLPGKGDLANEWVIIGAHYDHIGYGNFGSRGNRRGELHPGADDNASGTAGVLLAAERLKHAYDAMGEGESARSVLFLLFAAEEMGLLGSRHFVQEMTIPASQVAVMLNMDMIGRLREGNLQVSGVGTAEGFADWLAPWFANSGMAVETRPGGRGPSDHASFYAADIPVLHFFTGLHDEYHRPEDVHPLINNVGGARIAALVSDIALEKTTMPRRLAFRSTTPQRQQTTQRAAARVRLGVTPGSYDETERGLLIGDVVEGGAAAKGGLRKGDRIVKWNGEELANVFSYMQALAGHRPGDTVRVVVERAEREVELTLTLEAWGGQE